MRRYLADPRWLTTKYPGKCARCNDHIKAGERVFYYPYTHTMLCSHHDECAAAADRDFVSASFDEDQMNAQF